MKSAPLPPELERALAEASPLLEGESKKRLVLALARYLHEVEREEERLEEARRLGR